MADQFDVSEVSGKVQNMLFTRSDLRIFDKGEELWMAEKYGMKLLKVSTNLLYISFLFCVKFSEKRSA